MMGVFCCLVLMMTGDPAAQRLPQQQLLCGGGGEDRRPGLWGLLAFLPLCGRYTLCPVLARGGEGSVPPWEVETPVWLVGGSARMWGFGPRLSQAWSRKL